METAIIYSRISTEKQDNQTAIDALELYAKAMNYEVVEVFKDTISGRTKAEERQEFQKLMNFIESRPVDHILVWELSRLGRSFINILEVIKYLTDKQINVVIKKDGINTLNPNKTTNTTGKILIGLLGTMAELELDIFKERSKRGNRANVENGGGGTGIIKAYGFDNSNKTLVVNHQESKVVKLIFELFLEGLGCQQIAKHLNNTNTPTKFNRIFNKEIKTKKGIVKQANEFVWRDGTVYGILTNSIYCGERKYKGEVFTIPAIIEKSVFEKVQGILKSKYNKQGINRVYTNILKDKLKCGYCGHGYFMHKRQDGKDQAYKCISVRYKEQCGNSAIGIDKLNNALYILLNGYVKLTHNANADKIAELKKQNEILNITLENTSKALKLENIKYNNLLELKLIGNISMDRYNKEYEKIQNEIKKHNKQYALTNTEILTNKELIEKLSTMNLNESVKDAEAFKKYANEVIEEIYIYEIKNTEALREVFKVKGDKAFYFDLVSVLDTQHYFILSQRSNNMLIELMGENYDPQTKMFIGERKNFSLIPDFPLTIKV